MAAVVGVAEHGNAAVFVVVDEHALVDRRRVTLTPPGTPTHPYHHEGAWAVGRYLDSPWAKPIPLADAVALVERVHALAAEGARRHLADLAADVPGIAAVTIRACAELPPTIEARIRDHRAETRADSVLYRQAIATAARERGWAVHAYDRDTVDAEAAAVVGAADIGRWLTALGRSVGPPWRARHKLAAAAAIVAGHPSTGAPG